VSASSGIDWSSSSTQYDDEDSITLQLRASGYLKFARSHAIANTFDYVEFAAFAGNNVSMSVSLVGRTRSSTIKITTDWTVFRFGLNNDLNAPSTLGNPAALLITNRATASTPQLNIAKIRLVKVIAKRVYTNSDDTDYEANGVLSHNPPSVTIDEYNW
jgi:hypothetical protein